MKGKDRLRAGLLARIRPAKMSVPDPKKPTLGHHSMDEGPKVEGFLVVKKVYVKPGTEEPTGEEEVVVQGDVLPGKNLVVTQAQNLMAAMAAGLPNSPFNYIELGDPAPPNAPTLSDTTLQQTTGQRKASTITVSQNIVNCVSTWLAAEGNGFIYTEAGLYTGPFGAGVMFARKAGFSIAKNNSFQLQFSWFVVFRVQDTSAPGITGITLVGSTGTIEDYIFVAAGGEASVVVPIDFVVGAKRLEFFLQGQRMVPTRQYTEAVIGLNKGVNLIAFTLVAGDVCYFRHLRF